MQIPSSRAWTLRQKALIVFAVILGVSAFGALVYTYERYHRGLSQADLAGTWTRVDSGAGGGYYDFRRDGTIVMLGDDGQPTDVKGKWYAGGPNIYVRIPQDEFRGPLFAVWHIADISRDQFRVRIWENDKQLAVWRRMKPSPRPPLDLSDIPEAVEEVEVNP
jgi:hypothetical protein